MNQTICLIPFVFSHNEPTVLNTSWTTMTLYNILMLYKYVESHFTWLQPNWNFPSIVLINILTVCGLIKMQSHFSGWNVNIVYCAKSIASHEPVDPAININRIETLAANNCCCWNQNGFIYLKLGSVLSPAVPFCVGGGIKIRWIKVTEQER